MKLWRPLFYGNIVKNNSTLWALVLLAGLLGSCSRETVPEKYQMRGSWIASVKNIDWPSVPGLSVTEQKEEFRRMAGFHAAHGFNALFVQVRPATDAFYKSDTEEWSQWLTGTQGQAPSPEYDPLQYMIEETHSLGMEFHAWFNPYRAVVDVGKTETSLSHITRLKPGWFVKYGENLYFDPGIPEARKYLVDAISNVVSNYDVDAIHFDDYFYPYPIAGETFPDSASFQKFGRDFQTIEDWRRDNVNKLVKELQERIKSLKPYVKFGISPFGVWRNKEQDPEGSETKALSNYDQLYADVLKWLEQGWIDYVVPQLYWHIGFEIADYTVLADWWSKHTYGKHLYIGQAVYRVGSERSEEWKRPEEMGDHLRENRRHPEILGDVFFNARTFYKNPLGISDTLRSTFYSSPALVPPMPWIDNTPPGAPEGLICNPEKQGVYLAWDQPEEDNPYWYIIYRGRGKNAPDTNDPGNILAKLRYPVTFFNDKSAVKGKTYTYTVTALDRLNNESGAPPPITIKYQVK